MRLAVLWFALTACTTLNPAYDQPGQAASADDASPSTTSPGESTTTQPGDPTTSTTTASVPTSGPGDSSSTSTSEPAASTSDTTTGPTCTPQNEACTADLPCCGECATCTDGACVLDDALCGTCGVCNAGSCAPAKQNDPCVPAQDECPNRIWGLQDGVCYATKPAGDCDKDGVCIPDCQDQGAVIQTCDPLCLREPRACAPGGDPDKITFDTFCHHDNLPAGDCIPACDPEGTVVYSNVCDLDGMCTPLLSTECAPHLCKGVPGVCTTNCMSPGDCAPGHDCVGNTCV